MVWFGSLFSGCWNLSQVKCSQLHIQTWNRWIFSFDIDIVITMLESYNQHLSAPISHDRITKALSRAMMSSRNVDGLNAHQTKTHTYTGSNGRTNCELEILYYNVRISLPEPMNCTWYIVISLPCCVHCGNLAWWLWWTMNSLSPVSL